MKMEQWKEHVGMTFIKRPQDGLVEKSLDSDGKMLNSVELADIDEILLALVNYHTFLSTQIGMLDGRIEYLDRKLERATALAMKSIEGGHYLERKALAVAQNQTVHDIEDALIENKAKLSMVRPILFAVKNKIEVIKRIYDRRVRQLK